MSHVKRPSVLLLGLALAAPGPLASQLAPPSNGGLVELDRLLQRMGESRRILMIGAHPDDEDTALLSLMARGYGARAAYLSLSRGEGGQNLIGTELGRALGLLRSRELPRHANWMVRRSSSPERTTSGTRDRSTKPAVCGCRIRSSRMSFEWLDDFALM